MNAELIKYMSLPETLMKLVEYITTEPSDEQLVQIGNDAADAAEAKRKAENSNDSATSSGENDNDDAGAGAPASAAASNPFTPEEREAIAMLAKQKRCRRYPFVACEVLCCDVNSVNDTIMDTENNAVLRSLFSILDVESEIDSFLSGYFEKVVQVLLQSKAEVRKTPLINCLQY